MIQFVVGAAVATVANKRFKGKSKEEIKDILSEDLNTVSTIVGAGASLIGDKLNKAINNDKSAEQNLTDKIINKKGE